MFLFWCLQYVLRCYALFGFASTTRNTRKDIMLWVFCTYVDLSISLNGLIPHYYVYINFMNILWNELYVMRTSSRVVQVGPRHPSQLLLAKCSMEHGTRCINELMRGIHFRNTWKGLMLWLKHRRRRKTHERTICSS